MVFKTLKPSEITKEEGTYRREEIQGLRMLGFHLLAWQDAAVGCLETDEEEVLFSPAIKMKTNCPPVHSLWRASLQ